VSIDTPPAAPDEAAAPLDLDAFLGPPSHHEPGLPNTLMAWLTTTDHKAIGVAYAVTAMVFLAVGGALAGVMRAELTRPDLQVVDPSTYNSLFTIHGSVMVFLFAAPFGFALANYLVPLQIGAPDMAFPRLNALSYWLYLFGGLTMLLGFLAEGGAADFGWFAYPPLSGPRGSAGLGGDLWIVSVILTGTSGTLTGVNVVTTVVTMRAPGMTLFRMPILTWNLFLTSVMVVFAFPVLSGALLMLLADRRLGAHFYEAFEGGSPILYQHLFWFFGHPEVYIIALPFFGVVSEIFPVFSRKPIFGYKGIVLATLAITALSTSVWAHHMYATGLVALPFFAATTFLIAVPTGVKVFSWIGTMWGGSLTFPPPMLFATGFLATFVIGGVTGIMLAAPTLDFHLHDSYFVVAHFHYVMGGTVVFALFGAIYFWWPKVTGRTLSRRLGALHFWLLLVGFHTTFFVMHVMGYQGLPRRVVDYSDNADLERWNMIATVGYAIQVVSMVPFVIAVVRSLRAPATGAADPWNANSLEWSTTSPPPHHNFGWLPPIRSERPTFDFRWINDPDVSAIGVNQAWRARQEHDDRWFPLHRWAEEPQAEPVADDHPVEDEPEGEQEHPT
jgi:cytochrome c oxidase subunit 1